MTKQKTNRKPLTLYPLNFDEVIADVLKIKPEPKRPKLRAQPKSRKRVARRK